MLFAILTAIVTVLIILKWYIKRRRYKHYLRRYKSPKGWPFIGPALKLRKKEESLGMLHKYCKEFDGDNFLCIMGNKFILAVVEPNLSEFILGSMQFINKSEDYKYLDRWFGQGLLTSTGNRWRSHRKLITPSFHYTILEDFVEVFDKQSHVLIKKLEREVGKEQFEVFEYITLCTLDIICETAMGTTMNAQLYPDSDYVKSIKNMCEVIYQRVFFIHLQYDPIYIFSSTYRKEKKALKVIHGHTNSVIKLHKEKLKANKNANSSNVDEFGMKRRTTFLDALLECRIDGQPLTDEDIREEVDTFMFEGHDTTAVCISFTLYLLSKHASIQEKVYEEIQLLLGDNLDKPVTYEILQQMKYLEMVIKESLRMYPSVACFARQIKEEVMYDGEVLPKGLILAITPYALHRNPQIYPDPDKFDPERFNIENSLNRHPYAYIPFSAGPRNCIGQKFAMLELKSTISKVLRYYKLFPAIPEHNVNVASTVTIESTNGIRLSIVKRK